MFMLSFFSVNNKINKKSSDDSHQILFTTVRDEALFAFILYNPRYCIPGNFRGSLIFAPFAVGFNREFENAAKCCFISFVI